jgi:hypothetical protein
MSLLRLLSAGKSLVNIRDTEPRYRPTTQRLLPKFGSQGNPFCGRKAESPAESPAETPAPAQSPEARVLPAEAPVAASGRSFWARAEARASAWVAGLVERLQRRKEKPAKPAIPQFSKVPVQGELSLDRVRVMRNDLTDADLEVVAAKPKLTAQVADKPAQEAPSPMDRVTATLLGAGRT